MTPRLAVTYSSNNGNGIMGLGWALSLGQIRRCTRDGTSFEYENNRASPFTYAVPGDSIPGEGDYVLELNGSQIRLDVYLGPVGGGNHAFGSHAEEAFLRVQRGLQPSILRSLGFLLLDMNGDGLVDKVQEGSGGSWHVYLNTARGWTASPVLWTFPGLSLSPTFEDTEALGGVKEWKTLDINGDGLPDWVDGSVTPWEVWLNTGEGFRAGIPWNGTEDWPDLPPRNAQGGFTGDLFRGLEWWPWCNGCSPNGPITDVFDLNGDGVADWVHSGAGGWQIRAGQRSRIGEIVALHNGLGATTTPSYAALSSVRATQKICVSGDEVGKPCATSAACGGAACGSRASSDYESDFLPFASTVVTSLVRSSGATGTGHTLTTTYDYGDAVYDPEALEFRGFRWLITRDVDRDLRGETRFKQPTDVYDEIDRFDARVFKGKPDLVRALVDSSNTKLSETSFTWMKAGLADGREKVNLFSRSQTTFSTSGSATKTVNASYEYDPYNNRTKVIEVDAGDPSASRRTDTVYDTALAAEYVVDRPSRIVRGPSIGSALSRREFDYDEHGNVIAMRDCLDPVSIGTAACAQPVATAIGYGPDAAGLPTTVTDARGNTTTLSYGTTPYGWDNRGLYPAKIVNPLGHTTYLRYDLRFGKPLDVAQPTGQITSNVYDELGRILSVSRNFSSTPFRLFSYAFGAPGNPPAPSRADVWTREPTRASGYRETSTFFDAFGRRLGVKQEDWVNGAAAVVVSGGVQAFDAAGRPKTIAANFVASQPIETWEVAPAGWGVTSTDYDPLDRVIRTTNPDGITYRTADYSVAGEVLERDENATAKYDLQQSAGVSGNGRRTKTIYDALGRLRESQVFDGLFDESGLETYTVQTYDALDRVTATTAYSSLARTGPSSTTSFGYDALGRRTSMQEADSGTWTYVFDPVGNLVLQQDPKAGQHLEFCYDKLNRLRCTHGVRNDATALTAGLCSNVVDGDDPCPQPTPAPTGAELQSAREYDRGGGSWTGKLREVTDYGYSVPGAPADSTVNVEMYYDNLGLLRNEIRTITAFGIGPKEFNLAMTYDAADRLYTLTQPTENGGTEVFAYAYDPAGRPASLSTLGQTYATSAVYDAFGRPQSVEYGPGLLGNSYVYGDEGSNYRLAEILVKRPPSGTPTVLQDLLYTAYDKAGNLATISDTTPSYPGSSAPLLSAGWGYQYDGLGRLAQATSHGFAWPQGSSSFGYDDLENLSTARGLGFTHSGTRPHQIQSSSTPGSGSAYGYDGNGALESRPDTDGAGEDAPLAVEYDLQGRVARVEGGGTTVEYVSESSGTRAARRIGSQVTFYFGPAFEVTGASLVRHVRFGGRHIAESTITMAATSPLAMARIDGELRETLVARALLDFAAESPRLYPLVSLSREEGTRLFALLLLSLILLGATPGRVRLGLSAGRRAPFRRLRRGHVAVLLAVFGASLTPLTCVRPAEAGGGGGGGGGGNPPPPSYPVYFLHHDHLGSTVMATCYKRPAGEECADGEVVRYFRYDAYGMTKAFDGAGAPVTTLAFLVDRLYTGQRWEQAVRLYDYQARFYEPRIARFLSLDPLAQGPNPYTYSKWNPLRFVDPSGKWADELTLHMLALASPGAAASYLQRTGSNVGAGIEGIADFLSGNSPNPNGVATAIAGAMKAASGATASIAVAATAEGHLNGQKYGSAAGVWGSAVQVSQFSPGALVPASLGEAVALPLTLVAAGLFYLLSGLQPPLELGLSGVQAFYFGGNSGGYLTLGQSIYGTQGTYDELNAAVGGAIVPSEIGILQHEFGHVAQNLALGPAFLPAYVAQIPTAAGPALISLNPQHFVQFNVLENFFLGGAKGTYDL